MYKFYHSQIFKVLNYGSNIILNRFLGFILIILLARNINSNNLGEYFIFINLQSILVTISMAGIPHLIIKYCSVKKITEINYGKVMNILIFSLIFSLISLIILFGFTYYSYNQGHLTLIFISSFLTICNSILFFLFTSFGKIIFANFIEQIIKYIFLILIFLIALNHNYINSNFEIINIYIFVNLLIFLIFFLKIVKYLPLKSINNNNLKILSNSSSYLKYTFFLGIVGIFAVINSRADMIMLDYLTSDKELVSIYGVSTQFSLVIYLPIIAAIHVLGPRIAYLIRKQKFKILQITLFFYRILIFLITLFLLCFFYFYLENIIAFFIKDQFLEAVNIVILIGLSYSFSSLIAFNDLWMNYSGKEKKVTIVVVLTSLVNIYLNYLLIPIIDIYGAAIALSFSHVLMALSLMVLNKSNNLILLNIRMILNYKKLKFIKKIIY